VSLTVPVAFWRAGVALRQRADHSLPATERWRDGRAQLIAPVLWPATVDTRIFNAERNRPTVDNRQEFFVRFRAVSPSFSLGEEI
jgi:hypothetical protein